MSELKNGDLKSGNGNGHFWILLVDDDPSILEISKAILMDMGSFEIDFASSVDEAFKILALKNYDAVISDYEMPQKNGLQFLKELREQKNPIPFILFTGKGREEVAIQALNLGADGYHSKQGSPETVYGELSHRVKAVVTREKAELALIKSQVSTYSIIDSTNDMIWSVNCTDFGLIDFNQSLKTYFLKERGIAIEAGMRPETLFPTEELVKKWLEYYKRALKEGSFSTEYQVYSGTHLLQLTFNIIRHEAQVFGVSVFGKDITEQTRAEDARRISQIGLEEAQKIARLGTWILDIPTGIFRTSDLMDEIFGIDKTYDHSMKGWASLIHPEDRAMMVDYLQNELIGRRQPCNKEFRIVRSNDKATLWLHALSKLKYDDKGYPIELLGTCQDITERKKIEKLLLEGNKKFQDLVETTGEFIWEMDPQGRYTYCSPQMEKMWGLKPAEMVGKSPFDVMPPGYKEKAYGFFESMADSPKPFRGLQTTAIDGLGRLTYVETNGVPFFDDQGKLLGYRGISRDITESKQAEKDLKNEKQRLQNVIDGTNTGIWEWNVQTGETQVNECWAEMVGYTLKELEPITIKTLEKLTHPDDLAKLNKVAQLHFDGKTKYYCFDLRMKHKDGSWIWVYDQGKVVQWTKEGKPLKMFGTHTDITERKRLEEELQLHSEILANVREGVHVTRVRDGTIVYVNRQLEGMFGYASGELIGKNVAILNAPSSRKTPNEVAEEIKTILKEKSVWRGEVENIKKDGDHFWCTASVSKINSAKYDEGFVSVHEDITERKKAENKIRAASLYSRSLIEASLDPLVTISKEGQITDVNKATEDITGYSREELIGSDFSEYFTKPEKAKEGYQRVFKKGLVKDYPLSIRHKSGKIAEVLYNASVYRNSLGEIQGVFAAARDITGKKKAEELLSESEERYRLLHQFSGIGVGYYSVNGKVISFNDKALKDMGMQEADVVSKSLHELFPKDEADAYLKRLDSTYHQNKSLEFEDEVALPSGKKWFSSVFSCVKNSTGKIIGVQVMSLDTTERKKAEEMLRAENDRLETVTKNLGAGVAIISKDYRTLWANDVLNQIFGDSEGKVCYSVFNQRGGVCPECGVKEVFETGKAKVVHEQEGKDSNGKNVWSEITVTPIRDVYGNVVAALELVIPITERKKVEEKLKEESNRIELMNEKLRVVGGLTRHDVGNKLAVIGSNEFLLRKRLGDKPELTKYLDAIKSAVENSDKLLEFSRLYEKIGAEKPSKFNVAQTFKNASELLPNLDTLEIVNKCQGLEVVADSLLMQLFYNLLDNSLKHGEKVTQIRLQFTEKSDEVNLVYEDDGVGVPEADKSKLFTVGFTTGGGSGLGLNLVEKIIEVFGWTINEEGKAGKGAKFILTIPKLGKNGKENYQITFERNS